MEWTPEEKELFQELREFPKLHVPDTAREKMNELMKRQAAVDRKRHVMKLATGGVAGVAAAIALTVGILNYDQIKSKLDSQTADTNNNPTVTTPVKTGATFRFEKIYNRLGDKAPKLQELLKHTTGVVYGYSFGTSESRNEGDFKFSFPKDVIKVDHEQFRQLFKDDLQKIDAAIKKYGNRRTQTEFGVMDNFRDLDWPDYYAMLYDIDNAYQTIYNEIGNPTIIGKPDLTHSIDGNTKLQEAGDRLLRYQILVFGDQIQLPEFKKSSN